MNTERDRRLSVIVALAIRRGWSLFGLYVDIHVDISIHLRNNHDLQEGFVIS